MNDPSHAATIVKLPVQLATSSKVRTIWTIVATIVIAGLLYLAFRRTPLVEIWVELRRLGILQILILLSTDTVIYLLITARWWLIVQADNKFVPYFPLLPVRLAVFGISYFTIGPLVGGEALQILYLRRKHHQPYTRATASVIMDKLLELMANFMLLIFGLSAVIRVGFLSGFSKVSPVGLAMLTVFAIWPLIHVILLYRGIYPVSAILHNLIHVHQYSKVVRFIRAAEHLAGRFCQRHPMALLAAILVSITAAGGTLLEYSLILIFLHIGLPFWQTVSAWTVGWLSFLIPLPGGLGALEAGQVFTLALFGISAASALSVTFLIRGRDFLIGGVGLILAWNTARRE